MKIPIWLTAKRIELAAAVLMSAAALSTSWTGYQSTVWNGEQTDFNAQVTDLRTCATRASTRAGQQKIVDVMVFLSWAAAKAEGREGVTRFHEMRFREEFKPAFVAWLATNPRTNPSAPKTPFEMPQYRVAADAEADRCEREGAQASEASRRANSLGDAYILTSVIFAVVMFFAGATQSIEAPRARLLIFAFAGLAFVVGVVNLARLPTH